MALSDKLLQLVDAIGADIGYLTNRLKSLLNFFSNDLLITANTADSNGISSTLEYKRSDTTLFKTIILSGGTSPQFTTRTITYYDVDGTTVLSTEVFNLTYSDGRCFSDIAIGLQDIEYHGLNVRQYFEAAETDQPYYIPFTETLSNGTKKMFLDAGLHYNPSTNILTATGDFSTSSDRRLKTNITTIPEALDKVKKLKGVTFLRKDNGILQAGVIAQDVLKVLPEAVNQNGKYLSVAHSNLSGLFVEAIKDLSKQNTAQQKIIDKLTTRLDKLEAELKVRKKNG